MPIKDSPVEDKDPVSEIPSDTTTIDISEDAEEGAEEQRAAAALPAAGERGRDERTGQWTGKKRERGGKKREETNWQAERTRMEADWRQRETAMQTQLAEMRG